MAQSCRQRPEITSPGMNFLPCELDGGFPVFSGNRIKLSAPIMQPETTKKIELGVRPEFVKISADGFPVNINRIDDVGRYRIVKVENSGYYFNVYVPEDLEIPTENMHVSFDPENTHIYCDGWLHDKKESS